MCLESGVLYMYVCIERRNGQKGVTATLYVRTGTSVQQQVGLSLVQLIVQCTSC